MRTQTDGKVCAGTCKLNRNINKTMCLDTMVCVNMANDGFGKTRIQLTCNLCVILRNLDILPITRKDNEKF